MALLSDETFAKRSSLGFVSVQLRNEEGWEKSK